MDFLGCTLFLVLYYIRPHEWLPMLEALHPITFAMVLGMVGLVFRQRGLNPRGFFKTPHDWLMLAYFLWIAIFVPAESDSFATVRNMFIVYFVAVQVLYNRERLQKYLHWWAGLLFVLSMLALLSEMGIDPLDSNYLTHYVQKGRLSVNLSIFNNPNALGHTVVNLVPMLYFLLIWRRPVFVKEVGALLLVFPLWCLYLTQSKGAFLAGFGAAVVALSFGRPKYIQILVLALAVTAGWAGIQQLPRMQQLEQTKKDEGIQGRLAAWRWGYQVMQEQSKGIGLFRFGSTFEKANGYFKGPHSSYVEVGTEQGINGLFLFLAVLYCCVRTLVTARVQDEEMERLRRILMVMLVCYLLSSWMIGWGYRTTFYLLVACIAAFHRLVMQEQEQTARAVAESETAGAQVEQTAVIGQPVPEPALAPLPLAWQTSQGVSGGAWAMPSTGEEDLPPATSDETAATAPPSFWSRFSLVRWRRPGLLDLAVTYGLLRLVLHVWNYVTRTF